MQEKRGDSVSKMDIKKTENQPDSQAAGNQLDARKTPGLWTKNFTIITLGTVVSKLGSALSGFAIGLLVLDYTKSTFLYAMFLVMYNLPKVIVPALAGPYIDRYSRRKTIYGLDFLSAGVFGVFAVLLQVGWFNYGVLLIACVLLGCIDSVYGVAYESLYPMLITEGNYSKAYSIASTLETLTTVMIVVSAVLYNTVGIVPLFLADAVSFLIAAICETQIRVEEPQAGSGDIVNFQRYREDFKEGVSYLKMEKGLLAIAVYFMITMFAEGAFSTIVLPYFKDEFSNGEYVYMSVLVFLVIGRFVGGAIHYRLKLPTGKKFAIALGVYMAISVLEGTFLYFPLKAMRVFCFVIGILGVTSYNIRISATQSYVPDERKGRFNGIFNMMITVGMLTGQFASGVLTTFLPQRGVLTLFLGVNLVGAILIMGGNARHVKPIYNRQA